MAITEADVRHVAALARLEVEGPRLDALVRELNGILVHMDVLQRIDMGDGQASNSDVRDVETAGAGAGAPLREDEPSSGALAREREAFAPAYRDGFFLVPRLASHE